MRTIGRKTAYVRDLRAFCCGENEGFGVSEWGKVKSLSLKLGKLVPTAEVGDVPFAAQGCAGRDPRPGYTFHLPAISGA